MALTRWHFGAILMWACALQATAAPRAEAGAAARLPAGVQAVRSVEGIAEYRLPNGLQVLLAPDDGKPTTTVNLTVRVGSRHENYGETGMAHLLEHLMFKGSKRYRQPWAEFERRGLAANGSTSFDRTNYFASFAAGKDNLQWYLGWLADALVNSDIAKKDLDSEMTVVRNEMEMDENDVGRVMVDRVLSTMFDWHNYGKPTIGARSDVENVDIARLQRFYRTYYQPDNATLTVAGRFDPRLTLNAIAKAFGTIARPVRALPRLYTLEPVQDGERSFTIRRVGGTPRLVLAYHLPAAADPRYAAAEAVAYILVDEPSGRLHQQLVQQKLAAGVSGWAWDLADPGVLLLEAQLDPGQDIERARAALVASAESFRSRPITEDELARAKTRWLRQWEQRFANPERVGVALSESIAQGDWRLFFLLRDRVQALTLQQVQQLAEDFLVASNRTVGTYAPSEAPLRAPRLAPVDVAGQFKDFRPREAPDRAEAFDASPANIDARTQRFTIGDGAGGGIKAALLAKATRGSAVHAQWVIRFGDARSLEGRRADIDLLAALLDKGSATLSRQQVQDRLDHLKTELGIAGSPGAITIRMTSRRDTLPAAIELVGELLRQPALPADVLEELRRQALADVEQNRHEPEAVAQNLVLREGDPYPRGDVRHARSFDAIAEDLRAVSVERLHDLHRRFLGASHGEFAAVGDLDAAAVRAALQRAVGGWRSEQGFERIALPAVEVAAARRLATTPDKANAVLMVRQTIALRDSDPDYPALMLANWLLGGGQDSRLWTRIRERDGLSYGVQSWVNWSSFEANSPWNVWAIFAPQNRDKVERALRPR